ncbi:MAG TPA: DJ-1/PfpI family protein [Acidimicrobiales bacterium]|jgi:putative intracellular protease/amidase|nr:DJ-1/PfpI family protein [Acidimicrobiales bacterium]
MLITIPIYDRFTALDTVGPYEVLSRLPGAEVVFVAEQAGPVRTDTRALTLVAERALADVDACDVVVVPGGPGTREMLEPQPLHEWLRAIDATTQWTTSVCTGALLLGAAGLLDGLEATTHWSAFDTLATLGARPTERRVVPQGKVVTAAGVSAGIDMALWLAAQIAGDEVAKAIQLGIEYDPQPPFDSGSIAKASPETKELVRLATSSAPTNA